MKRILLILLLVWSFAASPALLSAQRPTRAPKVATPQTEVAGRRLPEAQFVNRVLPNGLEVIVLPDHSVPLVTIELAVKNGSYTEPPELNGLSHLYEHMFFKANRATLNREDYLQTIDQLGIIYNGQAQEELVTYYFTTMTPNFAVALRFMRDAARYPLFEQRQFEQEREVVLRELDRHESNPYSFLSSEMNDRLFYKHPSRKRPGGTRETVTSASTDMMRLIQQRYYVPNNSAIVVTGDVHAETVFNQISDLFSDWPRAEDPFIKFPPVEHPPLSRSESAIIRQPVQNVIISIGWHGPSIGKDDAATYAADVFSFILRQPDSRFQRALVDSGLVTGVNIGYYTQRNVGPINIIAQTTPDKARAAARTIFAEVSRFNDPAYYTDDQLESAKGLLEAEDLYSREKLNEYAQTLSFWWASTGSDYFRGYHAKLRSTARADISRYVTSYILGKPHVGLALMSEEAAKQSGLQPVDLIGWAGDSLQQSSVSQVGGAK